MAQIPDPPKRDFAGNLIYYQGDKACFRCGGTGNELVNLYRACSDCGGTGQAQADPT